MEMLKKHVICSRVVSLAVAKRPIRAAQAGVGGENSAAEGDQKISNDSCCPGYALYELQSRTPDYCMPGPLYWQIAKAYKIITPPPHQSLSLCYPLSHATFKP